MTFRRSRQLAIVVGIAVPLVETLRRWHELRALTVWWPAFFDDVLLGGFLLVGAWRAGRHPASGRPILSAAWGFMCGVAYSSLFFQWANLGEPDPSGLPSPLVVAIKAFGLAVGAAGLVGALRDSGEIGPA